MNLFSAQDVNYHSTLKKTVGGLYTKAAVLDLEPKIDGCVRMFTDQMLKLTRGDGPTDLDMSLWVHLFAFDCLGELNVSKKFGFLESGKDMKGMIAGSDKLLIMTGLVKKIRIFTVLSGKSANRIEQYAQAPFLQYMNRIMEWIWGMRKTNPVLLVSIHSMQE